MHQIRISNEISMKLTFILGKRKFVQGIDLQILLDNYESTKEKHYQKNIVVPHVIRPNLKFKLFCDNENQGNISHSVHEQECFEKFFFFVVFVCLFGFFLGFLVCLFVCFFVPSNF